MERKSVLDSVLRHYSTPQEATDSHSRLREGFAEHVTSTLSFRVDQLKKLRAFLYATENDLIRALQADLRQTRLEAITFNYGPVQQEISYFLNNLKSLMKPVLKNREPGGRLYVRRQPKGLILIMSAFNFPILLALRPVVGAIAAGNAICLKPSELATASEAYLVRLATVLDPRVFTVVTGGPDICSHLLSLKWDHIVYTGNGKIGRIVMTAAAKHLTTVTLELGGKSPAIVTRTADIPTAAQTVVFSRFLNCGQVCLATVSGAAGQH